MSIVCLYVVLDEFVGKSRITTVAGLMTPDLSIGQQVKDAVENVKEQAKESVSSTATELNEMAPNVFYDPKDPTDKNSPSYADMLQQHLKDRLNTSS